MALCFSLFDSGANMKRLREALNLLVGVGIRYDSFMIQIQSGYGL